MSVEFSKNFLTETIIFNVTDKYYNTEEEITVGEDTDGDGIPDSLDTTIDNEVVEDFLN